MSYWIWGALGNLVICGAYVAIAHHVLRGMVSAKQWRSNPLAVATGAIFFSCGIGHGLHMVHLLLPSFGIDLPTGLAARQEFSDWHMWLWDSLTAGIAVWYWTLRGRFPALVRGAAIFEDIRERQRQALDIHDHVVQGLAKAKLSLELGRMGEGVKEVEQTLEASRKIITGLLGEPGSEVALKAGDLRRRSLIRDM